MAKHRINQSILIRKRQGVDLSTAKRKVEELGGIHPKVDVTENYYRFRQVPPNHKDNFYTVTINKEGDKIVKMY